MSADRYKKNLHCLQARYPDYAEALRTIHPFSIPNIDPDRVRTFLVQAVKKEHRQAILCGTANGCAASILYHEYALHFLVIVESGFDNLVSAMHSFDLSDLLSDDCVHWLVGLPPSQLESGLQYTKSTLAAHGFQVIRIPFINPREKAYYDAILKELPGVIERETFSLKALIARGPGVQCNLIRNFPIVLDSYPLDEVINLFEKKPAIVVGAGPSLDKNVHQLAKLEDRAVLICVDTAARTLLPRGIQPHIIITTDPTPVNARHFENLDIPDEIVFAYLPDSWPDILQQYRHLPYKLCLFDNSNWYNEHLRKQLGLRRLLPRPMHVGESAIRLAIAMGCDPIIFVGLDLALPRGASATHAQASARALPIVSSENNQIQVLDENGSSRTQDLLPVPGIDGEPVLTYYSFKMYLHDLEQIIAATPVRWIDATEGGALKPGSVLQTLEETIGQLGSAIGCSSRFHSMKKITLDTTTSCLKTIRIGFNRLEALENGLQRIAGGEASLDEAASIWDIFLNDKEIRAFLDHAIFSFQLLPRLHKIPCEERMDVLRPRAREAANTVRMITVFWKDALHRCG